MVHVLHYCYGEYMNIAQEKTSIVFDFNLSLKCIIIMHADVFILLLIHVHVVDSCLNSNLKKNA